MITIENLKRLADNVKAKFVSIKQGKENYGKILAVNEDGNTETMSAPESMDVFYNEEEKRLVVSSKTNLPGNVSVDPTLSVSGNAADAKAVGNAVSGVIKYNEAQELTDEERAQARANIDAQGFNWHECNPGYEYTNYVANVGTTDMVTDWDNIVSVESLTATSTNALDSMVSNLRNICSQLTVHNLPFIVSQFASNFKALYQSGYVKNTGKLAICSYDDKAHEYSTKILYIYYNNSKDSISIKDQLDTNRSIVIQTDNTVSYNSFPTYKDSTLSMEGVAADAKAVGDKFNELTEKINEVEEDSSIPCKWEDIQDKPFGEEKVYDPIFENVELTSTWQMITGSNTVIVILNSPVKVIYNDVEYIFEEDGNDYGDEDLVNYPFYINCYKDGRWIVENENSGDVISLYASKIIINQLDEKFIPDTIARIPDWDVSATDSTNRIDNKPFGKVLEFVKQTKDYYQPSDGTITWSTGSSLIYPFKIIHNGNEYVFDTFPFGDETFTEYPFYISYTSYTIAGGTRLYEYAAQTANTEDTIEFYSTEEVDKQLDEAYIPDTIARTADIPTIPTQLSAFENDSEFITNIVDNLTNYYLKSETYTQDEVKALVSAIPKFSIQVVDTLPTEDISTTTVYLVKSGEETDNLYTEYIYVNGTWEYLGKQTVDLSGYALAADVLKKDNTEEYTPTEDYHPATKKYVDESINELSEEIANLSGGAPTPVSVVTDMTDTAKIYLYTGAEDGYIAGNWYYYDGTAWVSGGKYGETNTTEATSIEPKEDDIPKVFLTGDEYGNMNATKNEVNMEMDYVSKTEQFHSYIKIKLQGSSSLGHPKKNFTIKLYSDELRDSKMKKLFKDWKVENHKYVLKANYIDHSHARNIVCANLWTDVVASRSDYGSLPEELRNSPKNGAIDGFPVKVYVNGVYQGIYTWNIGKDDWLWGMDEDNLNHVLLCGEVNTNGTYAETPCNFRALWSGTDGTHWSVEVGTNSSSVKNSLNALISCVKDTDDETFKATIGNYLDVQSAIDYYIHQYVICGYDGLGKNILIGTYDLVKWIFGAYDMDSVLGNAWSGGISIPYDYACPEDYQEQFNLLFERIEKLFLSELKDRYSELRKTVYSFSNMYSKFEYFMDLIGSELYAEDLEIYSGIKSDTDIKQIRNYIRNRLEYCDSEFGAMVEPVPCTGITLNSSALSFTDETAQTLIATVTPGNTTDAILWESNDSSVATVSDGVVTPVANGNCTITVTCGNYSASCSVSVSGLFDPIPCTGVTLNETSLTFTGTGTQTLIATVTPDDTTDSLEWSSSDKTKATVVDGVVTAIANGSVTITATCGNYSASCSVSVSEIETAPLYTLENGTKTFSDGSVLEITNGNHVKLTKASTTASHVNIARVTQNGDDISSAIVNRVHEEIYEFNGKIKRIIIDFTDTCTASGNMSVTYSVPSNVSGTYDFAAGISIGTDVDKTITSIHEGVSMISFWTNAGKGVIEFDLKLYNDTERVI